MQERVDFERPRAQVFRRELPGGGHVIIGVERPDADRSVPRTCVWVERRDGEDRLIGHDKPLIASMEGDERSVGFTEMYRLAADNAAVARGIMQWRSAQSSPPRR